MSVKRKVTPYRYIIALVVFLFLNGAVYIVASVFLQNRSLALQSEQFNLDISLPSIIQAVAVDGVRSLQWFSLSSDESTESAIQVTGVADHYPEPLPPTNVVVRNTQIGHSVVLRWEPANGQTITGVEIYRTTIEPKQLLKDMELVTTVAVAKGEYIDEAIEDGTTYYYALRSYRVSAEDVTGIQYSAMTDVYSVIPSDDTAPRGPRWAQVVQYPSQTETGLLLQWDQVVDADTTVINIYRSTEPGALGTKIQSVTPDVTELVDTTVDPAVNYYYTITATDAAGNESSQTLYISRYGNGSPFVSGDQEASERIQNGN